MHTPFELPSEVTIYNVCETRDAMLAWATEQAAKSPERLQVSARDVAEVDGSGLQLLASLSNMELPWHLVNASEAFMLACRVMGFGHWLNTRVTA